jgi:hypothetical protein
LGERGFHVEQGLIRSDKMDKDKEEMGILKEMMGVMSVEEMVRVRYRLRKVVGSERVVGVLDEEIRVREEEWDE